MSVLIKGMEKPNHCMSCPMCNGDDDCVLQDCKDFGTWEDQMKACPLVELPEKRGTEGVKMSLADDKPCIVYSDDCKLYVQK